MSERTSCHARKTLLAVLTVLLLADDAFAYVGPGPGPEFIGYFASLLAWLGVVFSAILLYPLHLLRRRFWRRAESKAEAVAEPPADAAPAAALVPEETQSKS